MATLVDRMKSRAADRRSQIIRHIADEAGAGSRKALPAQDAGGMAGNKGAAAGSAGRKGRQAPAGGKSLDAGGGEDVDYPFLNAEREDPRVARMAAAATTADAAGHDDAGDAPTTSSGGGEKGAKPRFGKGFKSLGVSVDDPASSEPSTTMTTTGSGGGGGGGHGAAASRLSFAATVSMVSPKMRRSTAASEALPSALGAAEAGNAANNWSDVHAIDAWRRLKGLKAAPGFEAFDAPKPGESERASNAMTVLSTGRRQQRRKRPALRPTSRIGMMLQQFAGKDDWLSVTMLNHLAASYLQASWRGFVARRAWRANRHAVVDAAHRRIYEESDEFRRLRREDLQIRVAKATYNRDEKERLDEYTAKLFHSKAENKAAARAWVGARNKVDILRPTVVESDDEDGEEDELGTFGSHGLRPGDAHVGGGSSSFRAGSWMRGGGGGGGGSGSTAASVEEAAYDYDPLLVGQVAKLRTGRQQHVSAAEELWTKGENQARLKLVRQRRHDRHPAQARAEKEAEEEEAKKKASGEGGGGEGEAEGEPLPPELIHTMLLQQYVRKYRRMGLLRPGAAGIVMPPGGLPMPPGTAQAAARSVGGPSRGASLPPSRTGAR